MPLLESMACGVPSITMNRHAPPEVVGDSGLLVDCYSVDDIAVKMVEINQNDLLKNLSEKAYELSQKYSVNAKTIRKLNDITDEDNVIAKGEKITLR